MRHDELPRSSEVHPATARLHRWRPAAGRLVSRLYDVRLHGVERVPSSGPVVLAGNHIGVIDGPLMVICSPRPVHALTKVEMFHGRLGRFLLASGQIPLDRFHTDPAAVRSCLRVLRDGGVVGLFPEGTRGAGELERFHHGAAYLALVTGAPVVPVTFFGTRRPGGHRSSVPRRGDRLDIVFGEPWQTRALPWPRRREQIRGASALLWQHMRAELDHARSLTGRELPGPLPAGEAESDPDTGFVQRGAS